MISKGWADDTCQASQQLGALALHVIMQSDEYYIEEMTSQIACQRKPCYQSQYYGCLLSDGQRLAEHGTIGPSRRLGQ